MTAKQFAILLEGWRAQTLTSEQTVEFVTAVNSMQFDQLIDDTLEGHLDAGDLRNLVSVQHTEQSLGLLLKNINSQHKVVVHRVHFLRTAWFRWAAAIFILFGIGTYIFSHTSASKTEVVQTAPSPKSDDIMPGSDKAILTLSDGSKIELNNAASETITDGNLAIKNNNGQLIYGSLPIPFSPAEAERRRATYAKASAAKAGVGRGEPLFNTMTTPRGGTYQLILPDGSRVWLNAESSITFPTAFPQNAREVKITGEAYFEIKPNPATPFIVKTISDEIQVLGTSFNINAYNDAPVKTSLLEGSIKVNTTILKPGFAYQDKKIRPTNMEQDIAWKNGAFDFNNLDGSEAIRQLGRWYDVTFVFDKAINNVKFWGELDRNLTLQQVLRGLEGIGGLHFELNKKIVTVTKL